MASRLFTPAIRAQRHITPLQSLTLRTTRSLQSSAIRKQDAAATVAAVPTRKPAGAFRGGVFGFLLGSTLAGLATWYYIMEEYRVSNELLTEDIYALQAAVQRIHTLTLALEEKIDVLEKRGKK